MRSWDSVVSTATGYGWMIKGSEFESQYDQGFSLLHVVQIGSGTTQPPMQWVLGAFYPGV
jgi:hypothetical protein